MLGKLIKYEFKATAKLFLYFYAGLIVIATINMLTMSFDSAGNLMVAGEAGEMVSGLVRGSIFTLYILAALAVMVVTLIAVVMRFYKNLLGDEGYLMFTLPVKPWQHIVSKLIVATVWNVASTILIIVSILIVLGRLDMDISLAIDFVSSIGIHSGFWIILFSVGLLLSTIAGVISFYMAIAIGPHITKNRLGGTIIAYVIIYIVEQTIGTFLWLGMSLNIAISNEGNPEAILWITFMLLIVQAVIVGVPGYFVTKHFLKNKLNLT